MTQAAERVRCPRCGWLTDAESGLGCQCQRAETAMPRKATPTDWRNRRGERVVLGTVQRIPGAP